MFERGFKLISKHLPKFPREFNGHGVGIGSHEQPRMNESQPNSSEGPA